MKLELQLNLFLVKKINNECIEMETLTVFAINMNKAMSVEFVSIAIHLSRYPQAISSL